MTDFIMNQINQIFREYEAKDNITKEDIEQLNRYLDKFEEQAKEFNIELTKNEKIEISDRIQAIKSKIFILKKEETITPNNIKLFSKIKNFAKTKLQPKKLTVAEFEQQEEKSEKKLTAGIVATGIAIVAVAVAIGSISYKKNADTKKAEVEITYDYDIDNANVVPDKVEEIIEAKQEVKETVLPDNLYFDANDNKSLVTNMSDFIVDAMSKGIAIKDVMTEDEITTAEKDGVSLLTIEQLMDYYFVINIENIDPTDYARLNYRTKTTDTIINNYLACANIFMDDLLTAKEETTIDYTKIIADKESANGLQTMADMIAGLNSKTVNKSEITKYIEENYIKKYDDIYSVSANEQTYRFMFSFDELTNGQGIPNDINIILNEDKTYSCSQTRSEGERNKSERSQDYTDIKNIIDDKLAISIDNYDQNLTNISENELKTGFELEKEIKEKVVSLNPKFIENPKFTLEEVHTSSKVTEKAKTDGKASTVKDDNGKTIAKEELDKYGINQSSPTAKTEYENAVQNELEQNAINSNTHTITDASGNVVVSGSEVDTSSYNQGYSDGYYAGNNLQSNSPKSSGTSYLAGYSSGYALGKSDRNTLDASINNSSSTHFEDVTDKVVDTTTTDETYNGYTSDDHANDNTTNSSSNIESTTVFEPIEQSQETFEDYTTDTQSESSEEITAEPTNDFSSSARSALKENYLSLKSTINDINSMLNSVGITTEEIENTNGKSMC